MMDLDILYHEDCITGMQRIPDESIDAIICDLPYGVLHKGNPHTKWDSPLPLSELWRQYERVIKPRGAIVLFGQGRFSVQLMQSNPKLWRYNLVWDKCRPTGFLNARRMPLRRHEDILVFYKHLCVYHPQFALGHPNHSRGTGTHKHTNQCYGKHSNKCYDEVPRVSPTVSGAMKYPVSIISIAREHESSLIHPTQKPVELLRYLIRTYTDVGGVVMDNCMGSGTTAVAAIMEGRHFVGFERDEDYYSKALARIKRVQSQPPLFRE